MGGVSNSDIHRPLSLVTPNLEGPDVRALQAAINDDFSGFKLSGHCDVDGEFGPQTKRRANRILYLLGADPQGEGLAGPLFTKDEQKVIRDPSSRTKQQKERSERRVAQALAAQERHGKGAAAAVKYAFSQVGVTEHPLGSNRGPEVDLWTEFCKLVPPVFWCGCFAAYCAVHEGGAKVNPYDLVHNVVLLNNADAGGHGLERVSLSEARAGDIVSYTFAHIGLLVGPIENGRLHTVEGNTGQTGQQNNGGGVYEHTDRSTGLVLGIVRPDYS